MADLIKEPPHYAENKIEPIDYIISNGLNFCEGNVYDREGNTCFNINILLLEPL